VKLLWITNIPSPYRVDFFNELGKSCELTVLFEKSRAKDRDDSWQNYSAQNFESIIMRGVSYSADSALCLGVLRHLRPGTFDEVIVTNFSSPTGALAIAYLKATGQRYYLESDGGFPSGSPLKSWVKRLVIGGAHGYFSTSDAHDEYYLAYGALPPQLIRYPFTSVRAADVLPAPPTPAQKQAAKRQLGITQSKMILSVGQFIPRKGFDVLLKASASLPGDTAVCIVGGDPPGEYLQLVCEHGRSSVHFAGFKSRSELSLYQTAADLFVLPTREDIWGLVINEALAHALPVVTTDRCVAGLELVAKNDCGFLVPVGDVDALSAAMNRLLKDPDLLSELQRRALSVAKLHTIERMAHTHAQLLGEGGRTSDG
jgi:glycosyltransferase involved in cell wall biosynthesis